MNKEAVVSKIKIVIIFCLTTVLLLSLNIIMFLTNKTIVRSRYFFIVAMVISWIFIIYLLVAFIIYYFKGLKKMFLNELIITVATILVFTATLGQVITFGKVSGDSMLPTLKNEQVFALQLYNPVIKQNDIIIFKPNQVSNESDEGNLYIKRVGATPGDVITFVPYEHDNLWRVFINGEAYGPQSVFDYYKNQNIENKHRKQNLLLTETEAKGFISVMVRQYMTLSNQGYKAPGDLMAGSYFVPYNYYVVFGDNYTSSFDSRRLGFIHINNILGKKI